MQKIMINALLCLSLLFIICPCAQVQQQGTRVVFYIEHQVQQPEDYIQISIQIKSQKTSLQSAINEANSIVQKVQSLVKNYCLANSKNKKSCDDVVETSQYRINPIYQLVRKVPTFVAFSVAYQTVAKVQETKNIGKLADDILKTGVSKISSFQWKPFDELDSEEQAVTKGIQLVNQICSKINMKLHRIVAVSEVSQYDDQQEQQNQQSDEQEDQQEEQEQEEQQKVVYKFQIICGDKKKSK